MQKHKYRPFTTRDGSKACAECHGNEHAEQHVETFVQDYDRGDGVFVDAVQSHSHDWKKSIDGGTYVCECGAWK